MVKRGSPGVDVDKSPLQVELSDDDAKKLQAISRDIARIELVLERRAQEKLADAYARRRAVIKAIPKFWAIALMNSQKFLFQAQHHTDQLALSYLEDVWVIRDPDEPRCFTIEFYFKENPFFSDRLLRKEFKNVRERVRGEAADEDGITDSMLDFTFEADVEPSAMKIKWKSESKNLTKLYPRLTDVADEEDDLLGDAGSFFNFFEHASDPYDIGLTVANEIFPEVIDHFLGHTDDNETDSEEEEEGDEEEEIDLEKPRPKKQKKA